MSDVRKSVALALLAFAVGCNVAVATDDAATLGSACREGYAGDDCRACAAGYQDRNGNGFCAPNCESVRCDGEHATCDDSSGRAICTCVVGYTQVSRSSGSSSSGSSTIPLVDAPCVFTGGPTDPGFERADSWTPHGDVSFEPQASSPALGGIDPGWARLGVGASVSQTFTMPAFAVAEPLAMIISSGCTADSCVSPVVFFGDRGIRLPSAINGTGLVQNRICLGDAAYGKALSFSVASASALVTSVLIDHARFVPSVCPKPGEIGFGDGSPPIGVENLCELRSPSVTPISIPEATEHPALSFLFHDVQDAPRAHSDVVHLVLGEAVVARIAAPARNTNGTDSHPIRVCLPDWSRGFSHLLRFTFYDPTCAGDAFGTNRIDGMTLTSDATCETAPLVDGGFEQAALGQSASAWVFGVQGVDREPVSANGTFVRDKTRARSGEAFVSLAAQCGLAVTQQWISAPRASPPASSSRGGGGPLVRFSYRANEIATGGGGFGFPAKAAVQIGDEWTQLPPSVDWQSFSVCIPREDAGLPTLLSFQALGAISELNACDGAAQTLDVDDVSVDFDPSCL